MSTFRRGWDPNSVQGVTALQIHSLPICCVTLISPWQRPVTRHLGQRYPQRKVLWLLLGLTHPFVFFLFHLPAPKPLPSHAHLPFSMLLCPSFPPSVIYATSCSNFQRCLLSLIPPFPSLWTITHHPCSSFHSWLLSVLLPHPRQYQYLLSWPTLLFSLNPFSSLSAAGHLGEYVLPTPCQVPHSHPVNLSLINMSLMPSSSLL